MKRSVLFLSLSAAAMLSFAQVEQTTLDEFKESCVSYADMPPPICDCMAAKAAEELTENGVRFLVLTMNQQTAEASVLAQSDLASVSEAGTFLISTPAQCAQAE